MVRGLFEGWHLPLLLLVVILLFGGKRLPDAARGLGRSLRIFKSEMKQMQDEDVAAQPAQPAQPQRPPEPLEGRIVADEPGRASTTSSTPSQQPRDV